MLGHSYLYNTDFIDYLYETYLVAPEQVSEPWRDYFAKLQQEGTALQDIPHAPVQARFANWATVKNNNKGVELLDSVASTELNQKQIAVLQLIDAFRFRGHQQARLDPLQLQERPLVEDLNPEFYHLLPADRETLFDTGTLSGLQQAKLSEIIDYLQDVYCQTIGAEYMHVTDSVQRRWIQQRLEQTRGQFNFDTSIQRNLLERLTAAQGLEEFLHTKYAGQKRFSLEGAESLIPLLDELIQIAGATGVEELVLGMAHRGRLNVLVNTLGKRPKDLFSEFEGRIKYLEGSGDVKYHQGFASDIMTSGGAVHVTLSFNPSHLEIICPVVEGSIRARQERLGDKKRNKVLPVLIHGDAAFAGQGVVMETLNLSQTHGYSTGGTIHIIINNQIGFTTSDPLDSRSTLYCTDVAKMVQAPIFHVNGDDPEAVLFLTRLALDFRMTFNKDVVIDMVCYRRHGHNETDEPAATQPIMYQKIAQHPKVQAIYAQKLVETEVIAPEEGEALFQQYRAALRTKEVVSRHPTYGFKNAVNWRPYIGVHWDSEINTRISLENLQKLVNSFTTIPPGFKLNRSVERLVQSWQKMGNGELPFDWGCAETLAYASLVTAGYPVRLSGQDSARGTFAHRHAVWHHSDTGETYLPLQHLLPRQSHFLVINSLLSEEAVLAFEVGYSASEPEALVIWEAQFGDFVNNAQVVIDQFISSSEAKWQRFCAVVLLLPHGYDGQGPEHSSARVERFLQLCAEDNMQVCIPSTPAQIFHLLRRQMMRSYRKPLIIMTPKSLLRHKLVVSPITQFTEQGLQVVIDETAEEIVAEKVNRLLFCSGKVYYDLIEARDERKITQVAIIRIEQLYPLPEEAIRRVLKHYPHVEHDVWVQEEPQNQGAWNYIANRLETLICQERHISSIKLDYAGRPSSASPAVGDLDTHRQQLRILLNEAFGSRDVF